MVGHWQKAGWRVRKVSVDPLGVTWCHGTVEQHREGPDAKSAGVNVIDKYFACTNFRKLRTNRKYSENLTHAKISTPMISSKQGMIPLRCVTTTAEHIKGLTIGTAPAHRHTHW